MEAWSSCLSGGYAPSLFPADDKPWEVGSGLVARSYHFILYIFPHSVLHSDLSKQSFFHPTFYSLYFIQFLCGLQVFSPLISLIPFCLLHSLALSSCLISGSVDRQCYQHGVCVLVLTTDNSGYCLSVWLSVYQTLVEEMLITLSLIHQIALSPPSSACLPPNITSNCLTLSF